MSKDKPNAVEKAERLRLANEEIDRLTKDGVRLRDLTMSYMRAAANPLSDPHLVKGLACLLYITVNHLTGMNARQYLATKFLKENPDGDFEFGGKLPTKADGGSDTGGI